MSRPFPSTRIADITTIANHREIIGAIAALITSALIMLGLTGAGIVAAQSETSSLDGPSLLTASSIRTVQAPRGTAISQGDPIYVGITECTIGYIDSTTATAYTAGHCVEGADDPAHATVSLITNNGAKRLRFATAKPHSNYNLRARDRVVDGAVINPNRNVALHNTITGNAPVLARDNIAVGDMLCAYGAASQRTRCAPITAVNAHTITTEYTGTTKGDSGGPAWIINADGTIRGIAGLTSYIEQENSTFVTSNYVLLDSMLH